MFVLKNFTRFLLVCCMCAGAGLVLFSPASAMTPDAQPLLVSFPFSDGFESGSFGNGWTPGSAANGVAQIRTDDPHSGTYHAFIGQHQDDNAIASLDLLVNLANQTDVYLDYWWRSTGDLSLGAWDSGIYISDDNGTNWKKIKNFGDNFHYSHEIVNLVDAAAKQGLNLNNHFLVRFYFERRNLGGRIGGVRLDDIRLSASSQVTASFPLQNGFESATFPKGFYPLSTNLGVTKIRDNSPHNGNKHVFLGQDITGDAKAGLYLLVDLSNPAQDVYLDFWWQTTGSLAIGSGGSGVYISSDNGTNWKKIRNFSDNLHYSHEIINLSDAAAKQGLNLNDHFLISFHYEMTVGGRLGSVNLDDIRLTRHSNVLAPFPLRDSFETQTFEKGLYPASRGVGIAEITDETPHSGSYHVSLGQNLTGDARAVLFILADLANQAEDVYLDFWWRTSGDFAVGTGGSGIYISSDNGTNWRKIKNFGGNPAYIHEVINLSEAASAQGLNLNDHFLVSFHYERTVGGRLGSIRIDDIRLRGGSSNHIYLPFIEK